MKETFEQWKAKVDKIVMSVIGLGIDDMPDLCCIADWHQDEMPPSEAATELLETWADEGDLF